jgi:hypothetical protein
MPAATTTKGMQVCRSYWILLYPARNTLEALRRDQLSSLPGTVAKHLNAGFGEVLLVDLTAEAIETYLRHRLDQHDKPQKIRHGCQAAGQGQHGPSGVQSVAADVKCCGAKKTAGGESVLRGLDPGFQDRK